MLLGRRATVGLFRSGSVWLPGWRGMHDNRLTFEEENNTASTESFGADAGLYLGRPGDMSMFGPQADEHAVARRRKADEEAAAGGGQLAGGEDASSSEFNASNYIYAQSLLVVNGPARMQKIGEQLVGKRRAIRERLQTKFAESRARRIEERDARRARRKEAEDKLKAEGRFVDVKSNQHKGDLLVPEVVATLDARYPGHPLMPSLREIARAVAFNPRFSRSTQFKIVDQAARWLEKGHKAPAYHPQHQAWVARQKEIREQEGRNN